MAKVPQALLEAQDWGRIYKRLTIYAEQRLGSFGTLQVAEDLVGEAITQFLDPLYKEWDHEKQPDIVWHLRSIVNGLIRNHKKNAATLRNDNLGPDDATVPSGTGCRDEEEAAGDRDYAQRTLDLLLKEIERDDVAQKIVMASVDGVLTPREQAESLGLDRKVVYKARERLVAARRVVEARLAGGLS